MKKFNPFKPSRNKDYIYQPTGSFPVVGIGIGKPPKGKGKSVKLKWGQGIDILDINPDTDREYLTSFLRRKIRDGSRFLTRLLFRREFW